MDYVIPEDEDLIARLAELEVDLTVHPEPTVEEVEELVPAPPKAVEPPKSSGTLVLKYTRSVVVRDDAGRIIEIIGDGSRKLVRRDDGGRIVEIIEESEEEL